MLESVSRSRIQGPRAQAPVALPSRKAGRLQARPVKASGFLCDRCPDRDACIPGLLCPMVEPEPDDEYIDEINEAEAQRQIDDWAAKGATMPTIPATITRKNDFRARYQSFATVEEAIAYSRAHPTEWVSLDSDPEHYYLAGELRAFAASRT